MCSFHRSMSSAHSGSTRTRTTQLRKQSWRHSLYALSAITKRYTSNEEVTEAWESLKKSGQATQCSTEWLRGQQLTGRGLKRCRDDDECLAFVNIPERMEGGPRRAVRFFYYSTCAVRLGTGTEKRAKLPACTECEIQSRWKEIDGSRTGYEQA